MIRANAILPDVLDLAAVDADFTAALEKIDRRVIVCAGTGCMASGAMKVHDALVEQIAAAGMDVATSLEVEGGRHPEGRLCRPRAAARAFARWDRW